MDLTTLPLDRVKDIADLLQLYGGWGIGSLAIFACVAMFLRLMTLTEQQALRREQALKEQQQLHEQALERMRQRETETQGLLLQLTERTIVTALETKNAVEHVAKAVERLGNAVSHLEDKLEEAVDE